ncbi:MAG: PAS-domain containing protein [Pseudomonadota bacterium]
MQIEGASAASLGILQLARRDVWLCALLTTVAIAITSVLYTASQTRERDITRRALAADVRTVAELLARDIEHRERALKRMAHRWTTDGSVPRREWAHDAARYLHDHDAYELLAWTSADLSKVWTVAPQGEERLPMSIVVDAPAGRALIEQLQDDRESGLSGWFELPDGNLALYLGVPVPSAAGSSRFIGLIGISDWFDSVVPAVRRDALHMQLERGARRTVIQAAPNRTDLEVSVGLPRLGRGASLRVNASDGYLAAHSSGLPMAVLGLGLLLSLLVGVLAWLWVRGHAALRSARLGERLLERENEQRTAAQAELEITVKQLVNSRRHLDYIVSHMPLAAAIWSEDNRLLRWNDAFEQFHDSVREVIEEGLPLEKLVRAVAPARVAAGNAASLDEYVNTRLAQRRERGASIVRKVGDNNFFRIVECPLPDGTLLETFSDISDVMQEQERAAGRERELDDILAATSDGLSLYDANDKLSRWNERYLEIFPVLRSVVDEHKTFEELYRVAFEEVGVDAVAVAERVARHRAGDGGVPIEFTTRDGVTYLVRDQPTRNGGSVVTYSDVTTLKSREAELRRSNLELEQFAYVASHDLQEPLRMVASYTQLLERQLSADLDNDAREFMDYIVEGARRMQSLVNDLLAYSRVGSGELRVGDVALDDIVNQARQNLRLQLEDQHARLDVDELPVVPGIRTLLVQLFQNLIENALKFRSDTAPEITIAAVAHDGVLEVTVADNGIGIPAEHAQRIFEPFKRLHRKDEIPGNGIGLALCTKIARLHGGRIDVESEVGRGTRFHVQLDTNLTEPAG